MEGLLSSHDFLLNYCKLVTATGEPYDIKLMVLELNYFEDIFNNFSSGNLAINDSQNLINLLNMNGQELLYLSIDKPGLNNPIEKKFRIYNISNRKLIKDQNEFYVLHFASEEMLLSEQYRISKSFKSQLISDMIKYITKDFLQIQQVTVRETIGIRDIIVPNFKPFEAINWLSTFAISDEKEDSSFLFYENRDGYFFESIMKLYKQSVNPKNVFTYEPKNLTGSDGKKDLNSDTRNVISYEVLSLFNTARMLNSGAFSNKLITLDPLRLTFNSSEFDYMKYEGSGGSKIINNTKDRFGNQINSVGGNAGTATNGALRLAYTNFNQSKQKYIQGKIGINDTNIEVNATYRTAQLFISTSIRLKILIPGDVSIKVGDVIQFNLPNIAKRSQNNDKELDEYYSGKYLITSLRHMITQENKFLTVLEICKDSVNNDYASVNTQSGA